MALPQAIDIRISMLRLAPQCFAFTSNNNNIALLEPLNSPFGVQSTSVGEHWVIALKTQMQKHHSLIIS